MPVLLDAVVVVSVFLLLFVGLVALAVALTVTSDSGSFLWLSSSALVVGVAAGFLFSATSALFCTLFCLLFVMLFSFHGISCVLVVLY